jgi:hypothetical protein
MEEVQVGYQTPRRRRVRAGAVREVSRDGSSSTSRTRGEFTVPRDAVHDVHFKKVISTAASSRAPAIGHAHDAEAPGA